MEENSFKSNTDRKASDISKNLSCTKSKNIKKSSELICKTSLGEIENEISSKKYAIKTQYKINYADISSEKRKKLKNIIKIRNTSIDFYKKNRNQNNLSLIKRSKCIDK